MEYKSFCCLYSPRPQPYLGSTTAVKLEEMTRAWMSISFPFLSLLLSSLFAPTAVQLLHSLISFSFYTHSTPPPPLNSEAPLWVIVNEKFKCLGSYAMRRAQRKNDSHKVAGTKYTYWSSGSPKLEGTRPTGSLGWLHLSPATEQNTLAGT